MNNNQLEKNKVNKSMTPQNDFLFQKIFASKGNEDMLQEMLEEILNIKINNINITNEYTLEKMYNDTKGGRIDLKVTIDEHKIVDVEMQIVDKKDMEDRDIYYASNLYTEEMKEGEGYKNNKEVIIVSILSYNIAGRNNYIDSARFRWDSDKTVMSDKIQMYFIQLPKFLKQNKKDKKKLSQWLYFISQENKEELKMAIEENDKVAKAEKLLKEALADPETREILRIKDRIRFDREMDLEIATEEGRAEGIAEGKRNNQKQIAKKMKAKGMSVKEIEELTELTKEEIEKL